MAYAAKEDMESHDRSLISADRVMGTDVYDSGGTHIGRVSDIMLSKRGGDIAYLIMHSGGLFGIGGKVHPLPWSALTYDTAIEGYRLGMIKEHLTDAPSYDPADLAMNHDQVAPDLDRVSDWYDVQEQAGRMLPRDRTPLIGAAPPDNRVLGGSGAPAGVSGGRSGGSGAGRSGL